VKGKRTCEIWFKSCLKLSVNNLLKGGYDNTHILMIVLLLVLLFGFQRIAV